MNWVTIFNLIFLTGTLLPRMDIFSEPITLMPKWDLIDEEINPIEQLTTKFAEHYVAEYYQYHHTWLTACKATFHYLLHIAQSI